ncbi:MAG: hypothetical protein J0I12_28615 [Candidatus Eremiobacteraeota bacterium]|nr:hypothetical protein [Candidatus Eremiobacteraeota bacterium]
MKRWFFGCIVLIAVYHRFYQGSWRPSDIRVEGIALGDDLAVIRTKYPELQNEGDHWSHTCQHHGRFDTFESWTLRDSNEKVVSVRGWHLDIGSHHFSPLEPQSLRRLQALLGPAHSPQVSVFIWPQYHLKVFADGNHDSVTMATLDHGIR